jgi:long-chain acyl-CoA synthetase
MKDGWFATGDIGVMSADGFFTIVDRKKDMVLVSGFNVYPNEVEAVIAQMDSVLEVAVIGVPDATTGEAVRAYVVPNPEHADGIHVTQVIAHCKQQLTSYKVPKHVEVRDELPKSPVGKVLRKDLKAQVAAETTRS